MNVSRPEFNPDPDADRSEMKTTQRRIATAARFEDDGSPAPVAVAGGDALVAAVDQAFLDDRAVSAAVVWRAGADGGSVVERTHAVSPLSVPYIPGLLAFREGGPALSALASLDIDPHLLLVDGSGRIHFRQAGLATHLGVVLDVPTVGVAKSLLCGRPRSDTDSRPEGWRTPVVADSDVDAPDRTVLGYALQTRQFESGVVNPLYVSPGHRIGADTAADLVEACLGGYKLPKPVRLADAHADEATVAAG